MKICISGGHLTPAVAFIEHLQEKNYTDTVIFFGRLFSKRAQAQPAREKAEVEKLGATFIAFDAPKTEHDQSFLDKILVLPKMFTAICKAALLLAHHKPDVFVSFGGYLAVPIAIACWILRVPIITHEQTRAAGTANTTIARLATAVAVSHEESKSYFLAKKTHLVGNLIRRSVLKENTQKPSWLEKTNLPVLYITGGSQGSEIINRTVAQSLPQLTKEWCVIHQCGSATTQSNYKKELLREKKLLSKQAQSCYYVREWITESELSYIYSTATGVVSRSGANTVDEIRLRGLPAIFVPLPFSHHDEQYKNAQWLAATGKAILLEQKDLNPQTLIEKTLQLKKQAKKISAKLMQENESARDPAEALYALVCKVAA